MSFLSEGVDRQIGNKVDQVVLARLLGSWRWFITGGSRHWLMDAWGVYNISCVVIKTLDLLDLLDIWLFEDFVVEYRLLMPSYLVSLAFDELSDSSEEV